MGTWKNFDEIEDSLILDELLLLTDALNQKQRETFKMLAAVQGVEIDDEPEDRGDDDLPPEVIEFERRFREQKEAAKKEAAPGPDIPKGIGYETVQEKAIKS